MAIGFCLLVSAGVMVFSVVAESKGKSLVRSGEKGMVVHEWGTFTSLQGADGTLQHWNPGETSELPSFVYDWKKADSNQLHSFSIRGKAFMQTLQRMETPVVYFYANKSQEVNLTVRFPQGLITEWFPRAKDIGPSVISESSLLTRTNSNSLIHWNFEVMPERKGIQIPVSWDESGSHYFAARETDASYVRVDGTGKTKDVSEYEKFLFYRGAGSFATPLQVTMTNHEVTVANTGKENLKHLFLLKVLDCTGDYNYLEQLKPGEHVSFPVKTERKNVPLATFADEIGNQLSPSLTSEGLYSREAAAMVKTWKDSWFKEYGMRVLYVLPGAWTEETLPMTVEPKSGELVRVMVGRAELISPDLEKSLLSQLKSAAAGDSAAGDEARVTMKKLGRFAEPIYWRVTAGMTNSTDPKLIELMPKLSRN